MDLAISLRTKRRAYASLAASSSQSRRELLCHQVCQYLALTPFCFFERAEEAGFDAHLTKPVNLQKLEATMWRLLQERP